MEMSAMYSSFVAARFVPDAEPWAYLRDNLVWRGSTPPDALPHWSRFVSQIGFTPFGGGPDVRWLWRGKAKS
jgi:hypothetical protein